MRRVSTTALALMLGLWACDDGGGSKGGGEDPPDMNAAGGAGGVGGEGGAGGAGGVVEQPLLARAAGRMSIAQLARSVPVVTDGLRWMEDFGNGPVDMLQALAPTLGAPDYLRVTEENYEPTLIIAKFVQDAAFRICGRWVERDQQAEMNDRSLVSHGGDWASTDAELVKANLRALQLRFYARKVTEGDDGPIAELNDLFVNASSTAPADRAAQDGWLAVCIAMMTDPEFILY